MVIHLIVVSLYRSHLWSLRYFWSIGFNPHEDSNGSDWTSLQPAPWTYLSIYLSRTYEVNSTGIDQESTTRWRRYHKKDSRQTNMTNIWHRAIVSRYKKCMSAGLPSISYTGNHHRNEKPKESVRGMRASKTHSILVISLGKGNFIDLSLS